MFNKAYNKILDYIKPYESVSKVAFPVVFYFYFSFMLRERRPRTLVGVKYDVMKIKENMATSRKIRVIEDPRERRKKK